MAITSKKRSFIILAITAVVFSRVPFFLFNDPEGPNLLVLAVAAAAVYLISLTAYIFGSGIKESYRFWLAMLIQILLVTGLYFFGK